VQRIASTHIFVFVVLSLLLTGLESESCRAYAEAPDTITLTDGEQLRGKLVKVVSGTVTFHSDILGDVTLPLAKVSTLHAAPFAVIEKNLHVNRKTAVKQIPVGVIAIQNDTIHVSPEKAEERSFAARDVNYLIDAASFNRDLHGELNFIHGWAGTLTVGASLVKGTNSAQTYTGSVAFVRTIPSSIWMPASSKTTLNLSGVYGLAKDPEIIFNNNILQTSSTTKTDILHGDTEHDKYWSRAVFGIISASADHNFGSGLQLQQAYGGGLGWTVFNHPKNSLDLKGVMQYEQQQFYGNNPTENLASAAVTETWKHSLAHSIKFNEYITLTPTFNVVQAYSAVGNANFVFPVYKRLNFTLASTDNYLGDPPGGFQRNTFQFTTGITYVVK